MAVHLQNGNIKENYKFAAKKGIFISIFSYKTEFSVLLGYLIVTDPND
jgi:hypothetical protein